MDYIELSLKEVEDKARELYKKVVEKYKYDFVIFIAKGSYPIGKVLSEERKVPLAEIKASRSGGRLKRIIKPLLKFIPKKVLIFLRKKEMTSNVHEKNNDRQVEYDINVYNQYKGVKNILLVDDSIDSGYSIKECKKAIEELFPNSVIKVAVFNVMSKAIVKPDYSLYSDTMICGPWSNDSKYYKEFIKEYNNWEKSLSTQKGK